MSDIDAMPKGRRRKAPPPSNKRRALTRGRRNVGNRKKSNIFESHSMSGSETSSIDGENTLQQHIRKKLKSKQLESQSTVLNEKLPEEYQRKKRKQLKKSSYERLLTSLSINSKRLISRNITKNSYNPIVVEKDEEVSGLNLHSDDFFSANERTYFSVML